MPRAVPAATQTLCILRHLASRPRPVPAAAIARDLGLPRSTTYHLLAAMAAEGFVVHVPELRAYGLGVAAFEVGSAYLRHDGIERLARPLLQALVARTQVTAHLGALDGREVLYLVEERPMAPEPLVTDVGVRLPAHLAASGRALLAHLPAAQVRALFPDSASLTRRTDRGPRSRAQLRALLAATRQRGYATEDGEITDRYVSVACAAVDHTGHPAAAVAVTVRRRRGWPQDALAAEVRATAAALTRRLGGSAPS